MHKANFVISGPNGQRHLPIDPQGAILGRDSNCEIVLDHNSISRKHAMIYQDHFGRWVVKDLNSHNGVFVDGERVEEHAILPGQVVSISIFNICLFEKTDHKGQRGSSTPSTITVIDRGLSENIISSKIDQRKILSPEMVSHLNNFTEHLLKLSNTSDLYSSACKQLADLLNTFVAIVRLPCNDAPLPVCPETLACHLNEVMAQAATTQMSAVHFSKSVLDAIRSVDAPVMATSTPAETGQMMLTVVDKCEPHIVFAARVNDMNETIDALYIDIFEEKCSEQMFDFVEAMAKQINLVQKKLFFVELQKQEKAIRQANSLLKEKDRIKDEFVSRITHDIKGHLAAIQSFLQLLTDNYAGPLNDRQSEFLSRAAKRSEQLREFITELLSLTRMRLDGKIQVSSFSLPEVIMKSFKAVETNAREKAITLTSDIAPSVGDIVGNSFSITEVITSLLFNALKYTPDNKSVHLQARAIKGHIQIDIVDTGIGIPEDEIGNVFDEFFRGSNTGGYEGSGLGLSIVQQIIKRHGGEISVQSELGQGTKMTIVLPKNYSMII